jgi:hypothetical protein
MAHQKLDGAQVDSGLQKMGGKAGAQRMNASAFFETRSFFGLVKDVPGFVSAQRAVLRSVGENPERRPVAFPLLAQLCEQVLRQDGIAVLTAFALLHPDSHARRIDVCDLEIH